MSINDDGKLFDFDGDGELNSLEQNEYELFEFGDGSMHEPDGLDSFDDDDEDEDEDDF